jgi:hypothetical protein
MSKSETMLPNSVGRLSSLAAIRVVTAAGELTDWAGRASAQCAPFRIGISNPKIQNTTIGYNGR